MFFDLESVSSHFELSFCNFWSLLLATKVSVIKSVLYWQILCLWLSPISVSVAKSDLVSVTKSYLGVCG